MLCTSAGPGSHKEVYKCHKQEFIPTPTPDLAATVAKIKAETTPFEFIGDVGDVMLCECSSSLKKPAFLETKSDEEGARQTTI